MGSEQSKAEAFNQKRAEERRRQRQTVFGQGEAVSRDEVNRIIEQQRLQYEENLRKLQAENAARTAQAAAIINARRLLDRQTTSSNTNRPSPAARPEPSTPRTAPSASLATNQNNNSSATNTSHSNTPATNEKPTASEYKSHAFRHSGTVGSPAIPSTSQAISNDRPRNPYSFVQEELFATRTPSVYPNLNASINNTSASSPCVPSTSRATYNKNEDFVFIDNNKNKETQRILHKQRKKNEDKTLNCPTCNYQYGLTIHQCGNGHSSCRDCKLRGALCGVCRCAIDGPRNLMLEAYVSERPVPCSNADLGCRLTIKLADMDIHRMECPFSDMECPMNAITTCKWRGTVSQVSDHFSDTHPTLKVNVDTEMYLRNICNNEHIIYFVDMGPFNFILHFKIIETQNRIFMTVQFLGTKVSATKWTYELQVYNKSEPRRKYSFSDICHSNSTPVDDIIKDYNCVSIPLSYAMTFVNESRFTYKFYVKRDVEPGHKNRGRGRGHGRGRGGAT